MDIALLHCPAWLTENPPYAPAVLSAGLRKAGYSVKCFDLNIEFYRITEKEHIQDQQPYRFAPGMKVFLTGK